MNAEVQQELTIRGEQVQRIYNYYVSRRFLVNRRYQRKLVWTIEEKVEFVRSLRLQYPVPLILLASTRKEDEHYYEIIDGLQRLNAITAYIEQEFSVDEVFFDLNTMVESKELLDAGILKQREPVQDRKTSGMIASYSLPVSVYTSYKEEDIDEIFRRINASGRYLSTQELRSAGSTGQFASVVSRLASVVRGDVSGAKTFPLQDMKQISITNRDLPYGINVEQIFWVQENILTKEMVRESRDEEIIADIVSYMCLPEVQPYRKATLDDYYGIRAGARYRQIEDAVQQIGSDLIEQKFIDTYDVFRRMLSRSDMSFSNLLFRERRVQRIPRYFEVVFLAIYDLLHRQNLEAKHDEILAERVKMCRDHISVGGGGGTWAAENKVRNIRVVIGVLGDAFAPKRHIDPAFRLWATEFETILRQSYTEQHLYDFKQGLCRLDGALQFDENAFEEILKTLSAMANHSRNANGYVIVGVCDKDKDKDRIRNIFGADAIKFDKFWVTGIDAEAQRLYGDIDVYYRAILDKVRNSALAEDLKNQVGIETKLIRYQNKAVLILHAKGQRDPSHYNGQYFERHGSSTVAVDPRDFARLYSRFHGN